jgi:D-inositol-3-phosphate glycosyltransferase
MVRRVFDVANELCVADRVEHMGGLEGGEKWAQFEWADVFAYPTNDDAQPLVVLEAMAAALPVVSSASGGVPDTVADAGLLVGPGNHTDLALALRSLVDDPERRFRLGQRARDRYASSYTPEAFELRVATVLGEFLTFERTT